MYIWKLDQGFLQLKDAYFKWIFPTEIPEEAWAWLNEYNIFFKKIKDEKCRLGPLNVKCQNLEVYLGSKCTMDCTFCMTKAFYEFYGTDMEADHFDIAAIEHYIDKLMPESIFFSGGEPPDYMDRVEALIDLLKTKYNSRVKIILDTSGEHTEQIAYLKKLYPNMVISVTVELPRKNQDRNYRGQDFNTLCDNLERLVKDLGLTADEFNVKPYLSPDFDPSYYEYLHNKGFNHVELDVYHSMRPGVYFPSYSDEDIRQSLALSMRFDSIHPGDKNPVYLMLADSGNPCIKNISQFRQLEKGYVCRHDFDGVYTEGSLDNYYENKAGIYKLGLKYGEGYCCAELKHEDQSATATTLVRFMAAHTVRQHLQSLPDVKAYIEQINADYVSRDELLAKIDLSTDSEEQQPGEVICHLTDEYYNVTKLDVARYIDFLGLSNVKSVFFNDFRHIHKYPDDALLVLVRPMGFYTLMVVGIKSEILKKKSKTYWYNKILGECVDESLSYAPVRGKEESYSCA